VKIVRPGLRPPLMCGLADPVPGGFGGGGWWCLSGGGGYGGCGGAASVVRRVRAATAAVGGGFSWRGPGARAPPENSVRLRQLRTSKKPFNENDEDKPSRLPSDEVHMAHVWPRRHARHRGDDAIDIHAGSS